MEEELSEEEIAFNEELDLVFMNLKNNILKLAARSGLKKRSHVANKAKESGLSFHQAYISRAWLYGEKPSKGEEKITCIKDARTTEQAKKVNTPNYTIDKLLVLAKSLDCSIEDLLKPDLKQESNRTPKLNFTGEFYEMMAESCQEAMNTLITMEKIEVLKPLNSHDFVDLQFNSYNQKLIDKK